MQSYRAEIIKQLSLKNILSILDEINVSYEFTDCNSNGVKYISDYREITSDNCICFVENYDTTMSALFSKINIYISKQIIPEIPCIIVDDPRFVFIKLINHLVEKKMIYSLPREYRGIPLNNESNLINKFAIIEDGVFVGTNTVIGAGCIIKSGTIIGDNCIIRENTVVGCDGIALYKANNGKILRFPHIGIVKIGNNVEIGANCVIVKGALSATQIKDNVVIGNLCNVGHGVIIESKVWSSVGTLIGGNTVINHGATIGLGVCIRDNIVIEEKSSIGMGSIVTKSTQANSSYFGNPAKPLPKLKTGPLR